MGANYQLKEYLSRGVATEGQLLTERTIYDTLIKAVDKKIIPRTLAARYVPPAGIKGSSVDIDLETADSSVIYRIAEGAAVPISVPLFTSLNIRPAKYGGRPLVTKEMMEDGKWDLLAHAIERAGKELAENESSLVVTALDGAANTVTGGAAITIANVARAMQYVENADFTPDTMVLGVEVANDIRNIDTFAEADKFGSREMQEKGFIGRFYGMDLFELSPAALAATTSYIFDRAEAYAIAEKRPITVSNYDDQTHDLSGAVITQRLAVAALRTSSISKITTT